MPKVRKPLIYKGFRLVGKDEVTGSNPVISSIFLLKSLRKRAFLLLKSPKMKPLHPAGVILMTSRGFLRLFAIFSATKKTAKQLMLHSCLCGNRFLLLNMSVNIVARKQCASMPS